MVATDSDSEAARRVRNVMEDEAQPPAEDTDEALWAQAEERARPTVRVLLAPLSAHPEGLLERVTRRVTELYVAYERVGTVYSVKGADYLDNLHDEGGLLETDPNMAIELFAALVSHHFGGNTVRVCDEERGKIDSKRKLKEAFVTDLAEVLCENDLAPKLVSYAQDRMDRCFRSCREMERQRATGQVQNEVLSVFRFHAVLIAGLYHFGFAPLDLYWDTLTFCMLGAHTKAEIVREFGPEGLRDIANKTRSAHTTTIRSMIHMFFAGVTRDKPRQAALYCQLFNFSGSLLRLVHIGMPALMSEDAPLGNVVIYALERLLILFQKVNEWTHQKEQARVWRRWMVTGL